MPAAGERWSQDAPAKRRAREGNSPDRPLRPQSPCRVAKDVRPPRQPGCWLRSSHPSKECVTAHWPSRRAPTIHGAKHGAEAADQAGGLVVGERPVRGEAEGATRSGPAGSANAGMSSESGVGTPAAASPRFPGEGRSPRGQSGAKARPSGVAEAQRADIPVPAAGRCHRRGDGGG